MERRSQRKKALSPPGEGAIFFGEEEGRSRAEKGNLNVNRRGLRRVFCKKGGAEKKFSLFQIKIFAAGGYILEKSMNIAV